MKSTTHRAYQYSVGFVLLAALATAPGCGAKSEQLGRMMGGGGADADGGGKPDGPTDGTGKPDGPTDGAGKPDGSDGPDIGGPKEAEMSQTGQGPLPLPPPNQTNLDAEPETGSSCDPLTNPCRSEENSCLTVGVSGGVSKVGYCTKECNDDCRDGEHCVKVGDSRICARACPDGVCGSAAACRASESGEMVCLPQCTLDAHCTEGACDLETGLCSTAVTPMGGQPHGFVCDPKEDEASCEGICTDFGDGWNACSSPCKVGDYDTCPLCLPMEGEYITRASGVCFQPCSCNVNCYQADMICDPFTDFQNIALLLSPGVCVPKAKYPGNPGIEVCEP